MKTKITIPETFVTLSMQFGVTPEALAEGVLEWFAQPQRGIKGESSAQAKKDKKDLTLSMHQRGFPRGKSTSKTQTQRNRNDGR